MRNHAPTALLALALASCAPHDRGPGEPCGNDGDCMPDTSCGVVDIRDGEPIYECVALCPSTDPFPSRCGDGVCWAVSPDTPDVWGCFSGNDIPIGQPCSYAFSCVSGAICAMNPGEPGQCIPVCAPGGCGLMEHCTQQPGDCQEGLACAPIGSSNTWADFVCLPQCRGDVALCDDGSVCIDTELTTGEVDHACLPGGATPVGGACTSNGECVRGSLCLFEETIPGTCSRVCDEDQDCPDGERCATGFCTP